MTRQDWVPSKLFERYAATAQISYSADREPHSLAILIANALLDVLSGEQIDHEKIEAAAIRIYASSVRGIEEEQPYRTAATRKKTDQQLINMAAKCKDLALTLSCINRPAASALFAEGVDIRELARILHQAAETAQHAFGEYSPGPPPNGRPKKIEAAFVTESTAAAFESITGRRATYTTDPITGEVIGLWPDLLAAIFRVLRINASLPSQVSGLSRAIKGTLGE